MTWPGRQIFCERKAWLSGGASLRQMPSERLGGKEEGPEAQVAPQALHLS